MYEINDLFILRWTGDAESREAHSRLAALRDDVILIIASSVRPQHDSSKLRFSVNQNGNKGNCKNCFAWVIPFEFLQHLRIADNKIVWTIVG